MKPITSISMGGRFQQASREDIVIQRVKGSAGSKTAKRAARKWQH